jgi:hypothetical protein
MRRHPHEAEWTSFHKYFLENLVAAGIEPETSKSVARNFDRKNREVYFKSFFQEANLQQNCLK